MRIPFVTENTIDVASDINQSLLQADGLIVSRVTGIETAPPAAPVDGQRVAVAASGTLEFAGQDGKVAVYVEAGTFWQFYDPVLCETGGVLYLSSGGTWGAV